MRPDIDKHTLNGGSEALRKGGWPWAEWDCNGTYEVRQICKSPSFSAGRVAATPYLARLTCLSVAATLAHVHLPTLPARKISCPLVLSLSKGASRDDGSTSMS